MFGVVTLYRWEKLLVCSVKSTDHSEAKNRDRHVSLPGYYSASGIAFIMYTVYLQREDMSLPVFIAT